MIKLSIAMIMGMACYGQTVSLQANPIPMKTFGKISGLSSKQYGLWHVTAINRSGAAFTIDFPVIQQCFEDVSFLTFDEAQLVLTHDRNLNKWNIILNLGQDAELGAAVFFSPYALAAKPLLDMLQRQVQSNIPNENRLLTVLAKSSVINMTAGSSAVATMLAGISHGAHAERCTLNVTPATEPQQKPMMLVPSDDSRSTTRGAYDWILKDSTSSEVSLAFNSK